MDFCKRCMLRSVYPRLIDWLIDYYLASSKQLFQLYSGLEQINIQLICKHYIEMREWKGQPGQWFLYLHC